MHASVTQKLSFAAPRIAHHQQYQHTKATRGTQPWLHAGRCAAPAIPTVALLIWSTITLSF